MTEAAPTLDELLLELRDLVERARTMPMSASVLVNRDELLGLVDEILAAVPEEVRHARWLLKEREAFLLEAEREAEDIVEAGRVQAERMVERTEIAREARRTAQRVVEDAEALARRLRLEAEDYVDQRLAEFEVVLDRTMQAVQQGRERLQVTFDREDDVDPDTDEALSTFFDQDDSNGDAPSRSGTDW